MTSLLTVIRRVVDHELAGRRDTALAVVTTTFPHEAADDQHNYEVNVRLKHEDLELRHVPVVAPHIGSVAPPRVGDLVLVGFVGGDVNHPVVVGRFYAEDRLPPLHKDDELLVEHRVSDGTLNQLRFAADGSIFLQRDVTRPEDNTEAKATIRVASSGDVEITAGDSISITLTNDSEIRIKADGNPITIDCDRLTVNGNMDVNGDVKISGSGGSTTISGHTITGA
jgi:phage baseplate assembly protein gpV